MCGRCCEMDPILEIAQRHGLRVIEDCAHAIEATYRGRPAGLMGDAGCFSFYPTKNIATCDGGMVITRDRALQQRVKVLSLHGMTADAWSRFVGGPTRLRSGRSRIQVQHDRRGRSPGSAATGGGGRALEAARADLADVQRAAAAACRSSCRPPPEADSRHAYHLYTPLLASGGDSVPRDTDHRRARRRRTSASAFTTFRCISIRTIVSALGFSDADFPNATFVGERTISLPLSPAMSEQDVDDVATALTRIFRYYKASA